MGTITEKLQYLNETKNKIKQMLISKGQEVSDKDTFRSYVNKIDNIRVSQIFSSEDEMNKNKNFPENSYAIVYGTSYIGTYRLNSNKEWIQIGKPSDGQEIMDILNATNGEIELYDGYGGTEEEIMTVLNKIFETTDDNSDNDEIPTMNISIDIRDKSIYSSDNPSDVYAVITDSSDKELLRTQYKKGSDSQKITGIPFKKNGYKIYLVEIDNGIETVITTKRKFNFSMDKESLYFSDNSRIAPVYNCIVKIPTDIISKINEKFPLESITVYNKQLSLTDNAAQFQVTKGEFGFDIFGNYINEAHQQFMPQLAHKSVPYNSSDIEMQLSEEDFSTLFYADINDLPSDYCPTNFPWYAVISHEETLDNGVSGSFNEYPVSLQNSNYIFVSNFDVLSEDTECKLLLGHEEMYVGATLDCAYNCTIEHDGMFRKIVIPTES